MKIGFICLAFINSQLSARDYHLELTLKGDLNAGMYAPKIIDQSTGKEYIFKQQSEGATTQTWTCSRKVIGRQCVLIITDHHPSISSSCVYAETLKATEGNVALEIDLGHKSVRLGVQLAKDSHALGYFPGNKEVVIGRLRKIDDIGLVNRWIFLRKGDDGAFTADLPNVQSGEYLLDVLSKDGKVANGDSKLGYAEATKRIRIGNDDILIRF